MIIRLVAAIAAFVLVVPSTGRAQNGGTPAPAIKDTVAVGLLTDDSLAADEVDRMVRSRQREVQFCFEESGLKNNPSLAGEFVMAITLDPVGAVSSAAASHSEWNSPEGAAVEACVIERARRWKFPLQLASAPARHQFTFRFTR